MEEGGYNVEDEREWRTTLQRTKNLVARRAAKTLQFRHHRLSRPHFSHLLTCNTLATMVNAAVKGYLVAYNLASFFGWALILSTLIKHMIAGPQIASSPIIFSSKLLVALRPLKVSIIPSYAATYSPILAKYLDRAAVLHTFAGALVALVQSGAILEVVHAAIGFVKSPVPTTAIQVASRLWLVWGISERFSEAATSPFYASMVFAWSLTECVRYPFYANALMGSENEGLLWARYTLFYVLYPLGAASEAMLMFHTLPKVLPWNDLSAWGIHDYFTLSLFVLWWPGECWGIAESHLAVTHAHALLVLPSPPHRPLHHVHSHDQAKKESARKGLLWEQARRQEKSSVSECSRSTKGSKERS